MQEKAKFAYGIKGKLISAVAMLLVAVIMVVSSTYAWFTLSTAPEVTGIQTAIGANGALEMALQKTDGTVGEGMVPAGSNQPVINTYWGNLVDLSNGYGLDKISLYPSKLNVTDGKIATSMLFTPAYGADGRVSDLLANTVTGIYNDENKFVSDSNYGVRAVGVASGMTDRQLAYRNALSAAGIAMNSAKNKAALSLSTNGSALASVAIKHATSDDTYTQEEIAPLKVIVTELKDALAQVETSYKQYILAYAASSDVNDDTVWVAVNGLINNEEKGLAAIVTAAGASLPDAVSTGISAYNTAVVNVTAAETTLDNLTGNSITWDQLRPALAKLANPDTMKINGYTTSELTKNMSAFVNSVTKDGLKVTVATITKGNPGTEAEQTINGGVYADIADQCGDYSASIKIAKVSYNGIELEDLEARMETKTTIDPVYLKAINTAVSGKSPAGAAEGTSLPITEFYGYVLDLAFRTNAAESNLLLQTAPADRIYSDNDNPETSGKGSTMTFASTTTSFGDDKVKDLMKSIRVVFFTTNDQKVLATAKLDVDTAVVGADGVTANLYLYTTKPVDATEEGKEPTIVETLIKDQANATITALTQNTVSKVSVLVYLDGEKLTNADVAATVAQSATGTMNLQFSSSATLVPMEYADLHTPAQGTESTTTAPEAPAEP